MKRRLLLYGGRIDYLRERIRLRVVWQGRAEFRNDSERVGEENIRAHYVNLGNNPVIYRDMQQVVVFLACVAIAKEKYVFKNRAIKFLNLNFQFIRVIVLWRFMKQCQIVKIMFILFIL